MLCVGILWNNIYDFKDEILKDINEFEFINIFECFDLDLANDDYYEKFVRGIYSMDSIASWKIEKKISTMLESTDNRIISVIFMELKNLDKEYHSLKRRYVYKNLENLKQNIRSKYKTKIDNYFFDNIFHMTDNEEEFKETYEFLKLFFEENCSYVDKNISKCAKIRRV